MFFTEIHIGTHKMVSNRAPKCKYTQAWDSVVYSPSPVSLCERTLWTDLLSRNQLA